MRPGADQAAVVRAIGPRAVSGTVLLRLARLSAEARAVARATAVLGESAALAPVATLAGCDERAAAAATGELIRAEILRPDPPLGFVHPLVRDAVYHELPPPERELEHERAAQALRDAGADDEHVAAQLLDRPAPRRGLGRRAARARRRGGRAQGRGGERGRVPAPRARGAAAGRAPVGVPDRARHRRGPHQRPGGALSTCRRPTTRSMTRGRAASSPCCSSARCCSPTRSRRPAPSRSAPGRRSAPSTATCGAGSRRSRSRPTTSAATSGCSRAWPRQRHPPTEPGPGARALAGIAAYDWANRGGTAEATAALALTAFADGELLATGNGLVVIIATMTLVLADRAEALELLVLLEADAHRRGSLLDICSVHLWIGYTLWRHGELEEATDRVRASIEGFDTYGLGDSARAYADAILCQVLLARGDVPAARRALERSVDVGGAADAARHWLHAELALLVAEGRWDDAAAAAERFPQRFAAYRDSPGTPWRLLGAEALDRLGRTDEALALARDELELARRYGAPGMLGRALRVLGRLERDAGLARLEEAVAVLAGSTARLEHAKALAALGSALRHARRPAEAREPLREALELASACGAPALADEVRSELYAAGARPRTDAMAGVAALTASERRVADLAAGGETNRDIAQALFVTPKTVEVHLSNAYRKLGIRSRRELSAALG